MNCNNLLCSDFKLKNTRQSNFIVVQQVQLAVSEVKRFYRRRKKVLILCPLLVLGLSLAAAFWLPNKYKSSITILVEKDETLNPMVRYNLAVALASEDRLKSFNEIIYSRSTMNMLIDSLDLATGEAETRKDREELIEKVKGNVHTSLNASDSFTITYFDTEPERARDAVRILSDYFIKTKLQLENKRNTQTVDFFQNKLEELRTTVEQREKELINKIESNVQNTPRENRGLQSNLEEIEDKMDNINISIRETQKRLETVSAVSSGERKLEALNQLNLSDLPSGERLNKLLGEYDEYSSKYTSEFPKVKELKRKVYEAIGKLKSELESILFDKKAQQSYLKDQQDAITRKIEQTTIAERRTNQSKMDFDIYRKLYDEMKVKLEQAKTSRDLGQKAKNQFVVIDPPVVPHDPAKPNRVLLAGGGLFLGLFLGIIAAAIAEFLDTTVRRPEDIQQFNKPVVAFIPEA